MGRLTQENRFLTISDFGLGADTLVVTGFHGTESLTGDFLFEVDLLSPEMAIDPQNVIGKRATVSLQNDVKRHFNGYIKSLTCGEIGPHNHRRYRLALVPWLWYLSRRVNCRIFQQKNAKSIVSQIFNELGFNDFEFKASGGKVREYCVQYNESDRDFVGRLLEEEGITTYFSHSADRHQLLLVDRPNAFMEVAETGLEYSHGSTTSTQITHWRKTHSFRKGRWTLNDYNFLEPDKNLLATRQSAHQFDNNAPCEHFEYPGYYHFDHASELVNMRMEAEEAGRLSVAGASNCSSFCAGGMFQLAKHDTASEQGSYVLLSVTHEASDHSYTAGEAGESFYKNSFVCNSADIPIRPAAVHTRPVMRGPQSALVVGPAGEEIYTDEYGRIKVQFYWDREGQRNESSSCFLRVVQSWAGNQWGTSFIPRVGHEVIVSFLDGDPDRPLVTGSVYNGKNKPVYASRTQSGIKTRSTKGGTSQNFNELRFDDKSGAEQVYLHAERDFDAVVENNQSLTVEKDRTRIVNGNESVTVAGDRSKAVSGGETVDITKDLAQRIGGDSNIAVGKSLTIQVDRDASTNVGGSASESVANDHSLTANTITLQARQQLVLKAGPAQIVLMESGDIAITGTNIMVNGDLLVSISGAAVSVG